MSYYMRFFSTEDEPVTLELIETAVRKSSPTFLIDESKQVQIEGKLCGEIEINLPGSELFDEEIEEMKEFVEDAIGASADRVKETLEKSTHIVALRVLWGDDDPADVLSKIDPLWEWLVFNKSGLMQADGEGFYDRQSLILKLE